jgi:murein DD-endopeptidase MepM/ murein hydrolase activator NlpD
LRQPREARGERHYHDVVRRFLIIVILLIGLGAVGAYVAAGWGAPPAIEIQAPAKLVGQATELQFSVEAPRGAFSRIEATLEQSGRRFPLYALDAPDAATVKQLSPTRVQITRPIGRRAIPDLKPGAARLTIHAVRPGLLELRMLESTVVRDLELRFDPPRLSVASIHHFVNHGGSEMVVYRVTPPDVESGVRVGNITFTGYPAAGIGVKNPDPSLKVAFFALQYDQDLNTDMELYAVDPAGNQRRVQFEHRTFAKPFRRSRIEIDDRFLQRVVPDILENTPDFKPGTAEGDLVAAYLKINNDLRRRNAAQIQAFARQTSPTALWTGSFEQLSNSQVESAFADHRTYFYNGKEIDQQVHLGFDLAVTASVPIRAANRGKVLFADYLGIYGNCVIIDHGMGIQSLYGHLSSFDVKAGDTVEKDQAVGRSGATGLAGGDHLHFTMLVGGYPVSPVDWWDPHWIEDRITRKVNEAGGAGASPASASD